jgi:predicted peptidase
MQIKRFLFFIFVPLLLTGCIFMDKKEIQSGPTLSIGQIPCVFEKGNADVDRQYLLFLPDGYNEQKSWPMILFLHGIGERGDNLELVKKHGPPKIVEKQKDFPFIVVSPQCPEDSSWIKENNFLISLLDDIVARYKVDKDRIYLTGLSMGGYGTWSLASAYPECFAAIVPICGGGEPSAASKLKDMPVWAFHGVQDKVVSVKKSEEMVNAINALGGNAMLTVYPDAGHDSWTKTYDNPKLYDWFLEHRISDRKK